MPKLALSPDRTGDKHDNNAQHPADDFGAMSAAGEARRDAHRRQHCVKTRTKRAIRAIEDGEENSEEALRLAIKRIDKAAAKGVIHKNQAANRKARLMRRAAAQDADA